MEQSQEINELTEALVALQAELKPVALDSVNPFFKSKYASLHSVWEMVRPMLKKHGLAIIQSPDTLEDKLGVTTILSHKSGQWVRAFFGMTPSKSDPQEAGKICTYFRRYALGGFLGIVTEEDTDGEVGQHKKDKSNGQTTQSNGETIQPRSEAQAKKLYAMCKEADLDVKGFTEYLNEHYQTTTISDKEGKDRTVLSKVAISRVFDHWDEIVSQYRVGE